MEELVKFLEKVGVDNQVIAQLKDPEEGLNVDELAEEFKTQQREVYANDPDVVKKLETDAKGKARGSVEREIKRVFDISVEEWEENKFGDQKDYKKVLEFGKEKVKKQGTKTAQELQTEIQEKNQKIKWFEDDEIPRIKNESKERENQFYIERHLRKMIGECGDLIVSQNAAMVLVKDGLKSKGLNSLLLEDESEISFKTKDGLAPQDEGKTRNLTNMEVVKGILGNEKVLKESHGGEPIPPKLPKPPPVEKKYVLAGMAEAEKNLDNVTKLEKKPRGS